MTSSSTSAMIGMNCEKAAKLFAPAARVVSAACSGGSHTHRSAVVLDHTGGDHRSEPLPHVPLVEARSFRDLLRCRRWKPRHRVE